VRFYEGLVQRARAAIVAGRYEDWRREFLAGYGGDPAAAERD
jgi:queuine/archaeosine tRNA-ribosyltransferase